MRWLASGERTKVHSYFDTLYIFIYLILLIPFQRDFKFVVVFSCTQRKNLFICCAACCWNWCLRFPWWRTLSCGSCWWDSIVTSTSAPSKYWTWPRYSLKERPPSTQKVSPIDPCCSLYFLFCCWCRLFRLIWSAWNQCLILFWSNF